LQCEVFKARRFLWSAGFFNGLSVLRVLARSVALSENPWGGKTFTRIKSPSHDDMVTLVHNISQRIARYPEKVGLVERYMENSYLNQPADEDSLLQLQGASVRYRIAMGPKYGQVRYYLKTPYRDGTPVNG
jgi:hypothetical protein